MTSPQRRMRELALAATAAALIFTGCGSDATSTTEVSDTIEAETADESTTAAPETSDAEESEPAEVEEADTTEALVSEAEAAQEGMRTIVDRQGEVTVPIPAERIVTTDNRIVRLLEDWGIELVAAPLEVFPSNISYANDDNVANLGHHGEPNLEALIASDPDLVLTGYRFSEFYGDIKDLLPDAAVVDTDTDYESTAPIDELRWLTTLAGQALGHDDDAAALVSELDASIEDAKAAYDPEQTVMGLLTSGGDISYVAPVTGRAIGPIFPVLGFTAALDQEAEDVSHGDDISVEAIAAANPDWLIVLDRDASFSETLDEYSSAEELLLESEALANVTAITEGNIVYLPSDFYLTEDIVAYTELFGRIAKAMGSES